MIDARLPLALDGGGLVFPSDGRIAVFHPTPDAALPDLPKDRLQIVSDFKPHVDVWRSRGYACDVTAEDRYAAAIVLLPRAKAEARALIAEAAARTQGLLVIDGQKTDGVEGLLREIRRVATVRGPVTKAHGKLFWLEQAEAALFSDWSAGPALTEGGFWTAPGVFSADAIDPASALLAEALPDALGRHVADLGAGWGFLSAHVLTRPDVEAAHLVEAGHMALECARHNVTDTRAQFHWADATTWRPDQPLDTVVMNPPFHGGRVADPALGQAFIRAAARMLHRHGQLWMVANRHLPYEVSLQSLFATVKDCGGDRRFKLFCASRPHRQPGRNRID
ncbi:class I SAM-dependent methyltransferase [Roseobacter sinensis]|uniref:Methyltransferase n=1 Tax=Roseobacter sinensis TaxID=2931391 RepID=A0ABT3BDW6_9RHOB|nr:methyltransferase [Roseobacter sp. WL0113]MCV3271745.1 methyltransferase [Roseobacter sp. WL0113]